MEGHRAILPGQHDVQSDVRECAQPATLKLNGGGSAWELPPPPRRNAFFVPLSECSSTPVQYTAHSTPRELCAKRSSNMSATTSAADLKVGETTSLVEQTGSKVSVSGMKDFSDPETEHLASSPDPLEMFSGSALSRSLAFPAQPVRISPIPLLFPSIDFSTQTLGTRFVAVYAECVPNRGRLE